jgi:XRE family transcriptional regulator, regulator of sulfur utilization
MNYSKAVRIARAVSGLQQKELAEKAGLDPSHVSLIEKGARKPSVGAIEKICKALEIPEPLFTMLAAEAKDLKGMNAEDAERLGGYLANFVMRDAPKAKPTRQRKRSQRAA